jgi:hypothetical protein
MTSSSQRTLVLVLALAAALRLATIVAFPSLLHPDEVFQLYEQAHRWAFGYGMVPWEFQEGTRSPVLPFALSLIFQAAEPLFGGPQGYILAARIVLAASSLVAVAAVYRMGARESSLHGLLAGLLAAGWHEIVYLAGRPLTEAVATTVLLTGLAVASAPDALYTRRRLLTVGFCLGLCLVLRVHLAPGILVATIWVARAQWRARWLPLLMGGALPVAAFGVADWIVWGAPFVSHLRAFHINVVLDKASEYGVSPPHWYLTHMFSGRHLAAAIILFLAAIRLRASALWIATAAAIIAAHSVIPHKELRFIAPATACLAVVAALGFADLVAYARSLWPRGQRILTAGAAIAVLAVGVGLGFSGGFAHIWYRDRGVILAQAAVARMPDLCAIRLVGLDWSRTGGYAFLHRNVPILPEAASNLPASAYNVVIATEQAAANVAPPYRRQACFGGVDRVCVLVRDGPCTALPDAGG